jgi:3-methyladenine DNA glycosylase AlkC
MEKETLEEAAQKRFPVNYNLSIIERAGLNSAANMGFIEGAKYQQEQDKNKYSEEDVENILIEYVKTNPTKPYRVVSWFKQLKRNKIWVRYWKL